MYYKGNLIQPLQVCQEYFTPGTPFYFCCTISYSYTYATVQGVRGLLLYGIGGAFVVWLGFVLWKYFIIGTTLPLALPILFYNQADAVEGMVRRYARHPGVKLVLVDTGSHDETAAILQRLAWQFNLTFRQGPPDGDYGGLCYDARGYHGKELINIPLFQ